MFFFLLLVFVDATSTGNLRLRTSSKSAHDKLQLINTSKEKVHVPLPSCNGCFSGFNGIYYACCNDMTINNGYCTCDGDVPCTQCSPSKSDKKKVIPQVLPMGKTLNAPTVMKLSYSVLSTAVNQQILQGSCVAEVVSNGFACSDGNDGVGVQLSNSTNVWPGGVPVQCQFFTGFPYLFSVFLQGTTPYFRSVTGCLTWDSELTSCFGSASGIYTGDTGDNLLIASFTGLVLG